MNVLIKADHIINSEKKNVILLLFHLNALKGYICQNGFKSYNRRMNMKDLDYYLNLPYEIIIKKLDEKDGGGYFARYKDFPYIMGDGENEIEALKDLKEAFKGALEVMLEKGDYIKEPIDNEAKIRINITLPKSLVEAIDTISDNRSKFLADLANSAIKSYKIST